MASDSKSHQLHFVLFPFMAQGHMIPMMDIAKLLAQHGVIVTIVTTPLNAKRSEPTVARAVNSGLQIRFIQPQFPAEAVGLPKDCENIDMLPSLGLGNEFFSATNWLQEPVERLVQELNPRPSCIISDMCLPYTGQLASKLGVPRIVFNGSCCFCMLCTDRIYNSRMLEDIKSESEYFVVPELPHHIEFTKEQLPGAMIDMGYFGQQIVAAETVTYGIIINSFEEMESAYVQEYKKVRGDKVWCIGPVSLCNKDNLDKVERGDKASIQESDCTTFLDSQRPGSVIYVCFGSLCNLVTSQLIELALGLEASKKPFIWVIRGKGKSKELENWINEDGFEERTKERGIIIRGWAPQVVILSHPSVGGFLTHCGWNSTLEGISAGLPMVTWPLFADQFCNERLVVDVLKIGVEVGAKVTIRWGQEEKIGVTVKKENVTRAINRLMDEGEESEERRERAKELSRMAKEAMEEKGSSYLNMKLLIQDIMQQQQQACTM
ncbi:UDP-glycosyltransferase 73C1 [Ricinus communis]|uniref:UDP-glycosyltransferase 73C1 n=1 Tax=Ricinus communis TaxID=3988 RepID=UPI00201AAED2|nr:UDP-glycosyltransferase 73C1 [Ricinus communis]